MPLANYRIAELQIEGFRGFTTPQSLPIHGRNVFLFGPNGFGKSSVVEAIQWCLFGGSDHAVRNSIYEKQECRVVLRLESGGSSLTFERELRPGRQGTDLRIRNAQGTVVNLGSVFPEFAKLRSQNESAQVIFAAQHAASRRVTADISQFGRVLCFYLKLEDVPALVSKISDFLQEQQTFADKFSKRIEEVAQAYRRKIDIVRSQLETVLTNPPWGEGPAPSSADTAKRISDFVREISALLEKDYPADSDPEKQLRTMDEWIGEITQRDIAHVQGEVARLLDKIKGVEVSLEELRGTSTLIPGIEAKLSSLSQTLEDISHGETREAISAEIACQENAQSLAETMLSLAQQAAKVYVTHSLSSCLICNSDFSGQDLRDRIEKQIERLSASGISNQELLSLRAKLRQFDEVVTALDAARAELLGAQNRESSAKQKLSQLLELEGTDVRSESAEDRVTALRTELAALRNTETDRRDEKQKLTARVKTFRQELNYHAYRDSIKALERQLGPEMEGVHTELRNLYEFLQQVSELKYLIKGSFKKALDKAIPPLNGLLTEVYQRLTQQRSFELVKVSQDPENVGHLELRVASKRRPGTSYPINVLNGQASKALHLVPYFVFSRFQPELLELDLLLIDDPSESFDTSHVGLLIEELRLAAEHAQIVVASHEKEKFDYYLSSNFGENVVTFKVTDFDPVDGPRIEQLAI